MSSPLSQDLKYLIWDIEDRDDLPQEDIDLLWRVHAILEKHDKEYFYCDDCGEHTPTAERYIVHEVRHDITSANTGESAQLCKRCAADHVEVESDADPETGVPYGEIT